MAKTVDSQIQNDDHIDLAKEALAKFADDYVGVKEASEILVVDRTRIQQYARDGRLGTYIAGRYVFTKTELAEFEANPSGKHLK